MTTRTRPATTVVSTALGPKIPPFVGDAPLRPASTTAIARLRRHVGKAIPTGLFLATTAMVVAWDIKMPRAQGD